MKLVWASGLCMCLMGCMGSGDDGGGPAPKTAAAETTVEAAAPEAPSAMLAPKGPVVGVEAAAAVKPFSSQVEVTEAGVVENVSSSFDPSKALALKDFRARLGVQQ